MTLNEVFMDGCAAVPMVEAMVALVLVDQLMAQFAQCNLFPINPSLQEPLFSTEFSEDEYASLETATPSL